MNSPYERTYTLALGGQAAHPYWWYERGYWQACGCRDCCRLRTAIAKTEETS